MADLLSVKELEELKPGAIVVSYAERFWMRTNMVRLFINLHDGVIDTAKYLGDVWLVEDGPNHVIDTMLEEWEE